MYDCHVATFQEYPFTKSLNMKQSKIWPQSKVDMDERCFALGHRLRLMYKSKTRLESWAMDQCYNNLSCFGWLLVFFLFTFFFFSVQISTTNSCKVHNCELFNREGCQDLIDCTIQWLKLPFLSEESSDTP